MPRIALLTPLRHRDFALLWAGMTISLLGDGILFVAIPWQIYDLTDAPTALSLYGLMWSLGMVGFLLVGGSFADRVDRRTLMVLADSIRGLVVLAMGLLAVTGTVEVWHLVVLALVYGIAEAFFSPAFTALIPQLLPQDALVQANALQEVLRPATYRLAGPALGGALVGFFGAGTAFLVDAGTFCVAIACITAIRARPAVGSIAGEHGGIREGMAWAKGQPWFWATLIAASASILLTVGPQEVLLPYVIRHELGLGAGSFGLVLTAGGVGGIAGGLVMSQTGLPRRKLGFLYASWTIAVAMIAGYAVATAVWQLMALTFVFGVGIACGMVVWATLMQTRVPPEMMGRVTALDWVVSIGLSPVSFALTGPVAALAGADATLLVGGLGGALIMPVLYVGVAGLRSDDARSAQVGEVVQEPRVGDRRAAPADDLDALTRR